MSHIVKYRLFHGICQGAEKARNNSGRVLIAKYKPVYKHKKRLIQTIKRTAQAIQ
jgi:hypothetical protein